MALSEPPAACHLLRALIPRQQGLGGYPVLVECVGGAEATPRRGDEGLMGGERRGQSAGQLIPHLDRCGVWSRAAPRAIARPWREGPLGHGSRLQPRCQGRQGLLGSSGTGTGRAAERLKGLGGGLARLAPVVADAPLSLGAALG